MNIFENEIYKKSLRKISKCLPEQTASFLITGASGLIGSCIADILLIACMEQDRNYKIYLMGRNKEKLEQRFGYAKKCNRVFILEQDMVQPLGDEIVFDYIIHAASNADPQTYALYPTETLISNIYGMNNILEYCRRHLTTRCIFLSSFEVYGNINDNDEYKEKQCGILDFNMIRSCYPESKRAAELLVKCYNVQYSVDCVIARLSSVYGPTMSMNDSKAHAQFIKNALKKQNIILKSEGTQKRTYCYLIDCVSGILKVLFEGKAGEAYNVANSNSVATIADVAKTVADLAGTKVVFECPTEIERRGFSVPQNCVLNCEKIEKLGWKGSYSLKSGLEETLAILKEITD